MTVSTLTPGQQARAAYDRLARRRAAAAYVMTHVHLDVAVDAARHYSALAQATREALEIWLQFKKSEVC